MEHLRYFFMNVHVNVCVSVCVFRVKKSTDRVCASPLEWSTLLF